MGQQIYTSRANEKREERFLEFSGRILIYSVKSHSYQRGTPVPMSHTTEFSIYLAKFDDNFLYVYNFLA